MFWWWTKIPPNVSKSICNNSYRFNVFFFFFVPFFSFFLFSYLATDDKKLTRNHLTIRSYSVFISSSQFLFHPNRYVSSFFFFSSSKYFLLKNRKNSMYTRCVFLFFKRPNPESINFTPYLRTNVKFSQSRSISYLLMIKYNNTSPNTPIRQKFLNFKNVLLPYFYCLPLY